MFINYYNVDMMSNKPDSGQAILTYTTMDTYLIKNERLTLNIRNKYV